MGGLSLRSNGNNDWSIVLSLVRPTHDDVFDVFDFFETLWIGKRLISAFAVVAAFVGFGYLQFVQPKYVVSVPLTINIDFISARQMCGQHERYSTCMEATVTSRLISLLDNDLDWRKGKGSSLSISTSSPLDVKEYTVPLDRAIEVLTDALYSEAINDIALIEKGSADTILGTETAAKNILYAWRVVQFIDSGGKIITLGSISVVKSSPKSRLILALSVLSGGLIGVLVVLVRDRMKKRKEWLADV